MEEEAAAPSHSSQRKPAVDYKKMDVNNEKIIIHLYNRSYPINAFTFIKCIPAV